MLPLDDTALEHLRDLLFSPDAANLHVGLELLRQNPAVLRQRDIVLSLVLLAKLLKEAQLATEIQVLLRSYADRRDIAAFEKSVQALDYAFAMQSTISWLVFEQIWFVFEQFRPDYDPLLLKNKGYAQRVYETVATYALVRFQKEEFAFRLLDFLQENQALSAEGEKNYAYLLFHFFFPRHQKLDKLEIAIELLERAALQSLGNKETFYHAAGVLYQRYLQQPDKAANAYLQALAVNPQHHNSAYNLAVLYAETLHDWTSALQYIEQALAVQPEDMAYYLSEIQIYWKGIRDLSACNVKIEALLQRFSQQAEAWTLAGDFYASQNDDALASDYYHKALKINAKHIPALLGLARMYHQLHRRDQVAFFCQKILFLQPLHEEAQEMISKT